MIDDLDIIRWTIHRCEKCNGLFRVIAGREVHYCSRCSGTSGVFVLFLTGFLQVFLVTIQTYFISVFFLPGVAIVGFLISYVWSFNVKKIAFSGHFSRIIYSIGACFGAILGLFLGRMLYRE